MRVSLRVAAPATAGLAGAVLLCTALLAAQHFLPHQATIIVTSTNDGGPGSLRQALTDALDGDTIDATGVSGAILLTSDELPIMHNVTINGPGPANLAVNGNATFRVFENFASNAIISGLTITNGLGNATNGVAGGGGIINRGGLTLTNCTVSNNVAGSGCCYSGGGINNYVGATLTVNGSTISGNSATFDGGGIENAATLIVNNSIINGSNSAGRDGGGIDDAGYGISITVNNSIISGNSASGGGVCACGYGGPTTMISNSTISSNTANDGGGIENLAHGNNIGLTVLNSTLSSNTATGTTQAGGGISNGGAATVTNSTFSGNSVPQGYGGGIGNYTGSLTISESTFNGNSASPGNGGTLANRGGGTTHITNTVLSAGVTETILNEATFTSIGYNLASDSGAGVLTGPGDQTNTNPMLGPLQNNGGPTQTHDLLIGSPAINRGDPNFTPPPLYDQRGPGYDRVFGGRLDIGSFEVQSTPPAQAVNVSTRLRVLTDANVGIGGIIVTGTQPKMVVLRGIGPSLSAVGVPNPLANPVLELHGPSGFTTVTNDNWMDAPNHQQIMDLGLAPTDPLESAILASLPPGLYTGILKGVNDGTGVGLVEAYDVSQATASKMGNISTRGIVNTGTDIMIAGFILGGNAGSDNVIVRGIGPSLAAFGIPNVLANPQLELRDNSGTLIRSDDNWMDDPTQAALISAAGLAPTDPNEAAIYETLAPGTYTALLSGVSGGTGVGLVEAYDLFANGGPFPTPTPGTPTPTATASGTPVATPTATAIMEFTCNENWDSVTAPALPPGWVASNPDPGDGVMWVTTTAMSASAPNNAFIPDQDGISDKVLDRSGVQVTSASATLSFRNNFNLEMSGGLFCDLYVLEVSVPRISGGDFLDITDSHVGGTFVSGGYTVTACSNSPICCGRMAWGGNSGGYIDTVINLGPNLAGQTVTFRFRLVTDEAVAAPGVHIDNLVFTGATCP